MAERPTAGLGCLRARGCLTAAGVVSGRNLPSLAAKRRLFRPKTAKGRPLLDCGPVTLRFTWRGSDVRQRMTQKLIDAFEAKNPNIKIEGEYGEWSGYWDKLFLANSVEAGGIALADRGIPGNTEVRDAITPKLSAADAATAAFINDIADEVGDAPVVPPAGSSPAPEILTRFTTEVHFGRVSPEEAAKKSMEELKSAPASALGRCTSPTRVSGGQPMLQLRPRLACRRRSTR